MRDFTKISNLGTSFMTLYYFHLGSMALLMIICESLWLDWSI
jgi:hypothetical protein